MENQFKKKTIVSLAISAAVAVVFFAAENYLPFDWQVLESGITIPRMFMNVALILAATFLLTVVTVWLMQAKQKPIAEGMMLSRLYKLIAFFAVILSIGFAFGKLKAFSDFFAMFGGMLLGWSLQAPVSGFAAWILVSVKRPFRPGDRIQFPSLGLVGDVKDIGAMYTRLDQVGGSIGSEEAVGRYILVPNAMLFNQVVINYTVKQEAAYMLDEVVIRITYDSDWKTAERILLDAARQVTKEIIEKTGSEPYIRSDLYDYGVYLRLRYQTQVQRRAEISYNINKMIFQEFQNNPNVDMAIPYIYSSKAGAERKEADASKHKSMPHIQDIDMSHIQEPDLKVDYAELEPIIESISTQGLLQPILLNRNPIKGTYEILAGHLRYEACKRLGWRTIPAIIQGEKSDIRDSKEH
ncbi:MAG: ParB N-terminal domain-containing protein [Clostridia bacterium]|jgi:small-conductance mechanosensitive channel|nr:mechanosensitive ion channel [Clostridiaceae bacterium]